jgi:hypothetical protein
MRVAVWQIIWQYVPGHVIWETLASRVDTECHVGSSGSAVISRIYREGVEEGVFVRPSRDGDRAERLITWSSCWMSMRKDHEHVDSPLEVGKCIGRLYVFKHIVLRLRVGGRAESLITWSWRTLIRKDDKHVYRSLKVGKCMTRMVTHANWTINI